MKKIIYVAVALGAIILGLIAIIQIVKVAEIIMGLFSLTFGITSIIWAYRAKNSLSKGSELRKYANFFFMSLVSIVLFSISDLSIAILKTSEVSIYFYYPKYFLLTIIYLIFFVSSYQILSIGKMFGFNRAAEDINKVMKEKKKSRKL